ncbi:mechanosensitive ion channel domain-containing protein [Iodidimonas sp. SYSU 1G8]|uniref:mechanosensitive ion channel family protein n=1 Tax=Iodidimonas sp. SYSU 1G8 TaxID=3133967 RepID=UPI0031FED92E
MDLSTTIADLKTWLSFAGGWTAEHVLTLATLWQALVIAVTFFAARLLARPLRAWAKNRPGQANGAAERTLEVMVLLITPAIWLVLQLVLYQIARGLDLHRYGLRISMTLLAAWLLIRLLTAPVRNPAMARLVAVVAWTVAALDILGILDQTMILLEQAAIPMGKDKVLSLRSVLIAVLAVVVFVWIALITTQFVEQRLSRAHSFTPSARLLLAKIAKFTLIAIAIIVGLGSAGLDLTIFAFFGGALAVAVGFGLQKVTSNLFSGFILLLDRSIKPGDVVELQGTYGWVNKLATRYTSVITRDGTEYLIPNEDMITQPVVNWSHSNRLVRQHVKIRVSYDSDINLARSLCIDSAKETERVLDTPSPLCMLLDFEESAVILELRFWIEDPQNGITNVQSDVRLKIWDKFQASGIRFPFSQHDLHIVTRGRRTRENDEGTQA